MLLHNLQKFDDNLRRWSDQHLPFAPLFGIGDVLEAVVQNADKNHCLWGKKEKKGKKQWSEGEGIDVS